jgi:hypothetical protein
MYVVDISRWPQDNLKPSEPATAPESARLRVWRTDPHDTQPLPPESSAGTVSALEAGHNGWVEQANFVVFGLLTIAFAVGVHPGLRTTRAGIAGSALLFVSGIGLLLAAVFPLREDAAGITYDPGGHIFVSSAIGRSCCRGG